LIKPNSSKIKVSWQTLRIILDCKAYFRKFKANNYDEFIIVGLKLITNLLDSIYNL
jgi:hypothetical protein